MVARVRSTRGALNCSVVIALFCFTACDWPWRHDMVDQPSRPASAEPRSPPPGSMSIHAEGSVEREAAEFLRNPLGDQSSLAVGRSLYGEYCVPCHGESGTGVDGPVAKYFPSVGDLTTAEVQRHGDGWLYVAI